ncbi:MAG TPA: PEGA domain-containing protein [Kofleriaceae bacterium]|nr:PEGA domain-containing protein [Kofleriaceae bacterium]
MAAVPRRRAPMLWAPTMHGDDECTRVEDHPPWDVVANAPSMNPSWMSLPIPSLARRPSPAPAEALAEPAAPMPSLTAPPRTRFPQATPTHSLSMQPMPMQPPSQPLPRNPMPAPQLHAQPVTPGHFYSYAESCAQHVDSTAPVAPLPFAELATHTFPRQIPRWSRIAMPIGGAVAIAVFVAAFFGGSRDSQAPAITSHSEAAVVVAAAAPAPAEIPADSHWQPRTVVPTMAAPTVEPAAVPTAEAVAAPAIATAVEAAEEVERAPVAVKQPAKRSSSSSRKPAPRIAAQAPRADDDPIAAEIAKPASVPAAKAKGPGKAVVSSDTPSLVYIDGRATGLKTPTTINLAPGAHKITLISMSTRKAKTADVEIKSGVSVKVHRDLGASASSSSKSRRVKVDASSPLGDLRPRKAW